MKKAAESTMDGGSKYGDKVVAKPRKISQLIEANLTGGGSTNRGRALTFSDAVSVDRESEASTSTQRRPPPQERDRAASLLNLKRGASLYFGKDITTSMWWKYRQIHGGVGALRGEHRSSGLEYENSYQLEPKVGHKFAPGKVEDCIRDVLGYLFEHEAYDPKRAAVLASAISDAVKQRVKMLCGLERYRLIVNVDIGSRVPGQEVVIASRYLWNTDTDGFATVSSENRTMYAVVTVYGVYMD